MVAYSGVFPALPPGQALIFKKEEGQEHKLGPITRPQHFKNHFNLDKLN